MTNSQTTNLTADAILTAKIGRTAEQIRENIRVWFRQATPDQYMAGMTWYDTVAATCKEKGEANGVLPLAVSAIYAHFSPQNQWVQNERMAHYFVENGGTLYRGYFANQIAKATAALNATDEDSVMASFSQDEKAQKTRSFVRNCAGDLSYVTIDTWMLQSLSLTVKELNRKGVYGALAEQFVAVAAEFNIAPAQLQAIVWVTVRGRSH